MRFLWQSTSLFKEYALVVVMFLLLSTCLFFGDGKQVAVEVVAAGGILIIYIIAHFGLKKQREMQVKPFIAWSVFLLYLTARTLFSDDIGYSIYATIRYFEAFMIYYVFYCFSSAKTPSFFMKALLFFCVFAIGSAAIATFFPQLINNLPLMNLLYPTYGHNHVVDVVLLGFPVAFCYWVKTKKTKYALLLLLFVVSTIFSFARATLVIEAAVFNVIVIYTQVKKKRLILLPVIGIICSGVAAVALFFPYQQLGIKSALLPKSEKQNNFIDIRLEYWKQATHSIENNPLFGTGPGTFFLSSQRYESEPGKYSWFAHNYFFELISETGSIGFILFMMVCASIMWHAKSLLPQRSFQILFMILCLAVVQSLYDYGHAYIIVWFLIWVTISIVHSNSKNFGSTVRHIAIPFLPVSIIGTFYLVNIVVLLGMSNTTFIKSHQLICAQYLPCVNLLFSKHRSDRQDISQEFINKIGFFHKKNPATHLLIARQYLLVGLKEQAYAEYQKLLILDPQNIDNYTEYLSLLLDQNRDDYLLSAVDAMISTLSQDSTKDIGFFKNHWKIIQPCFNKDTLLWTVREQMSIDYHSKSFYYAGLCLIRNNEPEEAKELFRIAAFAHPGWSNIYIDYASLMFWKYHEESISQDIIRMCKKNSNAQKHCSEYDRKSLPLSSVTDGAVKF